LERVKIERVLNYYYVEERENYVECWELKKFVLSVKTIVDGLI
jgi:hypothetical protein